MQYKIYKQFQRDEERLMAQFNELNDAKFFVEKKAEADGLLKIKVIYKIYKSHELIEEISTEGITSTSGTSHSTSSGGASRGATHSPFSTAPRPPGAQKWGIPAKDDDKDKQK